MTSIYGEKAYWLASQTWGKGLEGEAIRGLTGAESGLEAFETLETTDHVPVNQSHDTLFRLLDCGLRYETREDAMMTIN